MANVTLAPEALLWLYRMCRKPVERRALSLPPHPILGDGLGSVAATIALCGGRRMRRVAPRCLGIGTGLPGFELSVECSAEARTAEEVAVRAVEGVLDQLLCSLRVRDANVKVRDLALGQLRPASIAATPGGD